MQNNDNRVVVVDDFPEFTINLKKILSIDEVEIKVYDTPEGFLNYTRLKEFKECEVLIVDYSMPNLTGYEVFRELHSEFGTNLPNKMILYTANVSQVCDEEKNFMKKIGVELLRKPSVEELIDIILDNLEDV